MRDRCRCGGGYDGTGDEGSSADAAEGMMGLAMRDRVQTRRNV